MPASMYAIDPVSGKKRLVTGKEVPQSFDQLKDKGIDDGGKSPDRCLSAKRIHKLLNLKAEKDHSHEYMPVKRYRNLDLTQEAIIELETVEKDTIWTLGTILSSSIEEVTVQPVIKLIDNDGDVSNETTLDFTESLQCSGFNGFPKSTARGDTLKLQIVTPATANLYKINILLACW